MMEDKAKCGLSLYWHNCYKGTQDLWHPDAYSHPAKMAIPLAFKIMEHLKEIGLLCESDTILDPMSGISTTGIVAGVLGHKFIGVELEEKFIELSKKNKEYAERRLYKSLDWTMIKGDSRRLSELLEAQGLKSITSPPYQDSQGHPSLGSVNKDGWGKEGKDIVKRRGLSGEYGESEGQVGNLKSITSPPYEQSITGGKSGIEWQEEWGKPSESRQPSQDISYGESKENIGNLKDKPLKSITSPPYGNDAKGLSQEEYEKKQTIINDKRHERGDIKGGIGRSGALGISVLNPEGYGTTEGQIGSLPDKPLKSIVSPPYGDAEKRDRSKEASNESEKDYPRGDHNISAGYQGSDENIGRLSDKPLESVMSPPYESSTAADYTLSPTKGSFSDIKLPALNSNYGETEGQIGQVKAESYLSAMSKVYREIGLVSSVLTVVLKDPTRNGKIRTLGYDTWKLLEKTGWKVVDYHRALLFGEISQGDLFGSTKKKPRGRISFFKLLSYQKGNPVSNYEHVIIAVRVGSEDSMTGIGAKPALTAECALPTDQQGV